MTFFTHRFFFADHFKKTIGIGGVPDQNGADQPLAMHDDLLINPERVILIADDLFVRLFRFVIARGEELNAHHLEFCGDGLHELRLF